MSAKLGWLFADFSIENRGGGHIYIKNISKRDAKRAQELINERLRKSGAPVVAESGTEAEPVPVAPESAPSGADDLPNQIRKLAEVKDAGVLTEEEYAEKKAELLSRM